MSKIDWYYIYSPRYYPFHFYLQENIPSSVFNAKGIFIEQSVFDEHLYKHKGEHFFSRITVKVENIIRIINQRLLTNNLEPFFFTDCDILVRPNAKDYIFPYTTYTNLDILFQKEHKDETDTANPGVMLIWPNKKTLVFWETILKDMKTTITMEMAAINRHKATLQYGFFHTIHVCSSITATRLDSPIYHILCDSKSRELDIGDKMYEALRNGQNMDKYIEMTKQKYGQVFI